jgi:hypothetical protein
VFFEPVAVAFEADDLGVVDDPADHGRGDGQSILIAEERVQRGDLDAVGEG